MKNFLHVIGIILCLLSVLIGITWVRHIHHSVIESPGIIIIIPPEATAHDIANELAKEGVVFDKAEFFTLLKTTGWANRLRAGEYFLPPGSTLVDIIRIIASGNVLKHRITFVDGWNIYQVLQVLNSNPYIQHTLIGKSPADVAKILGLSHPWPEGLFYPDTYIFTLNTSDITILKQAQQEMQQKLGQAWSQRDPNVPYTDPYQALIVASMIQKETAQPFEMPIIAGIILKRLKVNMRLQIDAAVIYGLLPNFSGKLTGTNLRTKTPYNTYIMKGLPPTPIALPDIKAIQAALHPMQTDAWYYVAKGDGTHVFSATLQQQDAAIRQYQTSS